MISSSVEEWTRLKCFHTHQTHQHFNSESVHIPYTLNYTNLMKIVHIHNYVNNFRACFISSTELSTYNFWHFCKTVNLPPPSLCAHRQVVRNWRQNEGVAQCIFCLGTNTIKPKQVTAQLSKCVVHISFDYFNIYTCFISKKDVQRTLHALSLVYGRALHSTEMK